jgi:hypothetical protein
VLEKAVSEVQEIFIRYVEDAGSVEGMLQV